MDLLPSGAHPSQSYWVIVTNTEQPLGWRELPVLLAPQIKETSEAMPDFRRMNQLFDKIKTKKGFKDDTELAQYLGTPQPTLGRWKDTEPSPTIVCNLLTDFFEPNAQGSASRETIWPVVEFFPIDRVKQDKGSGWLVFAKDATPFQGGLRDYLYQQKSGIYVFFDSAGHPLYVGKTEQNEHSLWHEITQTFNRDFKPDKSSLYEETFNANAKFLTVKERGPLVKPEKAERRLCDVAKYFSAYGTTPAATHGMEAFLVRVMANMLWNEDLPNFTPGK